MNIPAEQNIESSVGRRIRRIREEMGLSLRTLAERCGLSINAISRIERGANSPTISSLHRLARALEVPIIQLFAEENPQNVVFTKKEDTVKNSAFGSIIESLGFGLNDQRLEPFRLVINPGVDNTTDPMNHTGQEFVYCLEGAVEYTILDHAYRLSPGDSLLFDASLSHGWCNVLPTQSVVLIVIHSDERRQQSRRQYHEN